LAKIEDWDMPQLGILQVRVCGLNRFRILSSDVQSNGLVVANTAAIADDTSAPSTALTCCAAFLQKVIPGHPVSADFFRDAFWVSMRLTELLPLGSEIKQKMLELTDATMRLEVLQRFLTDQGLISTTD
jgi:Lon protease-like protein